MRILLSAIMFIAVALPISLAAESPSFTASVDANQVPLGEYVEVRFTLTGSRGGANFQPPPFSDFAVLSGPNQSTSMQIINGSVSSSVSFSYVLQPRVEGTFTIGSASIELDGKKLQTQPLTIQVKKGSPRSGARPGTQGAAADVRGQIAGSVLLKASVDKTQMYQGEQLTVTYKVYTRVQILNYNVTKTPALTGFWSEDLDIPKEIRMATETLDGKQYAVGLLRKVALFPQQSGSLNLDPMEIEVTVPVRRQSNDFFDQFFDSSQPVNYRAASEPLRVTVLPLPGDKAPPGFKGAVGKYELDTQMDKQDVKTNDAVTLKVKISGRGNLKLLEPPDISIPPDIESYDPKISNSVAPQGNTIAGSRTFEYLLIPRHSGDQKIPPFAFSYFDTERQQFVTLKSPEFIIRVQRGGESGDSTAQGLNRENVKQLSEDIRFIKSGNLSFQRRDRFFIGSLLFYVLVLSPPFLLVLFLSVLKKREKTTPDGFTLRSRKAKKMAKHRLAAARKLLHERQKEAFYSEVSRALWGYLSDRLGIPMSELSRETVASALQNRSVSAETASRLSSTMDQCEFARFAPGSDSMQMENVLQEAVTLVSTIEEQLQ